MMAIPFFTYLNSNLSNKLNDCNNFNELIDICVENVFEFHSVIKLVHGSRFCNLENCQVKSVYESLGEYLSSSITSSDRLLTHCLKCILLDLRIVISY